MFYTNSKQFKISIVLNSNIKLTFGIFMTSSPLFPKYLKIRIGIRIRYLFKVDLYLAHHTGYVIAKKLKIIQIKS